MAPTGSGSSLETPMVPGMSDPLHAVRITLSARQAVHRFGQQGERDAYEYLTVAGCAGSASET
jgi:hypothetical protein